MIRDGLRGAARATSADAAEPYVLASGLIDYYALLGIDDTAPQEDIKSAYRALQRVCHVDVAGACALAWLVRARA